MNGHYHRSAKGGGEWEFFNLPEAVGDTYTLPLKEAYLSPEAIQF